MHRFQIKEMSKETEKYIKDTYGKELRGIQVLDHIEKNLCQWALGFGTAALTLFLLSKGTKRVKRNGQFALDVVMQNDQELDNLFRLDDENVYTEQQQTEE